MVLGGADLVGRAHTGQGKTMVLVLSILKCLINGPAKRKKKNVYSYQEIKLKRGIGTPGRIKDHTNFLKQDRKTIDLVGNDEIKTSNSVRHIAPPCNRQAISRLIPYIDRLYSSGGSKICFTKTKDQASELSGLLPGARIFLVDIQQSQHKITVAGFRKDYISFSGRIGGADNTGVVVMLYGSRKSSVSRIEKQVGKRFEHVSASQPNDIAKAVGMEAAEKSTQVCDSGVCALVMIAGKRKLSESAPLDEEQGGNNASRGKKSNKVTKRKGARKKKEIAKDESIEESSQFLVDSDDVSDNESDTKEPLRTRKKDSPAAGSSDVEEGKTEKKVRQRIVKKDKDVEDGLVTTSSTYDEVSDAEEALKPLMTTVREKRLISENMTVKISVTCTGGLLSCVVLDLHSMFLFHQEG
ncbi:P-loop containing nucleoside triphosphate hydrolase protein [Raphanus sativus]|nr:P-loop containing nucleoside triphosphate hydrolase protein [Raphanus sativus]